MYTFSKMPLFSYQLNDTSENIGSGIIQDKDYIGMSSDSSVSYDIGTLKPGEKREFVLYLYFKTNEEKQTEEAIKKEISDICKFNIQRSKT